MSDSKLINQPLVKLKRLWIIIALIAATTGAAGFFSLLRSQAAQRNVSSVTSSISETNTVSARGRIEPQGDVTRLSASRASGDVVRIDKLLVEQGDRVSANQIVAILDNIERLKAALGQAEQRVNVAQAVLAKVRAGAKVGEINAQMAQVTRLQAQLEGERKTRQATIARLQAQLSNATVEFNRYQMLYQQGAVEASRFDSKRLEAETIREQFNEAKAALQQAEETLQLQIGEARATLNQIAEVRPTDVQVAEAEVSSAIAAVEQARAYMDLAYVRAPKDSQVLQIYAFPGEVVDNEGIADLGQTGQMYVVAEIYETDVNQVQLGQPASMTSDAFSGKLQGKVTRIGLQVRKQKTLSTDPVADVDRRVVEVNIRLTPEDAKKVAGLTNLQVEVLINI